MKQEISKHKTVLWPKDEDFRQNIRFRRLYGVGVTPYLLSEYDRSLGGDQPLDVPWIEHVGRLRTSLPLIKEFKKYDAPCR